MMEIVLPARWKEEFALAASIKREDVLHKEKMAAFERRQRDFRENERIRHEKREREEFVAIMARASERQIASFHQKLDSYDAKTVEALMENRVALDLAKEKFDQILSRAHVLPDGRKVFRSREDTTRVYDEFENLLPADVVDPDSIDPSRPAWEEFKEARDAKVRLEQERQSLIDYQTRLDETRAKVGGDVTAQQLDDLGADLDATMPDAVRRKIMNDEPQRRADLDDDGVRITARPAAPAPG